MDGLVGGGERVEILMGKNVRMTAFMVQNEDIRDVDDADAKMSGDLRSMAAASTTSKVSSAPMTTRTTSGLRPLSVLANF